MAAHHSSPSVPNYDAPPLTRAPSMEVILFSSSSLPTIITTPGTSNASQGATATTATTPTPAPSKRVARVLDASQLALHGFMHMLLERFRIDPAVHIANCTLIHVNHDHKTLLSSASSSSSSPAQTSLPSVAGVATGTATPSTNTTSETTASVTAPSPQAPPSSTPPAEASSTEVDEQGVPLPPPILDSKNDSNATTTTTDSNGEPWWRKERKNFVSSNVPAAHPPPPHDLGQGPESLIKLLPIELRTLLLSWLLHAGALPVELFNYFILPDMQHIFLKNGNSHISYHCPSTFLTLYGVPVYVDSAPKTRSEPLRRVSTIINHSVVNTDRSTFINFNVSQVRG
jgi:hypothetical protein